LHRSRASFDDGWFLHEGELDEAPLRLTLKAPGTGALSDLTVAERPATARTSLLEMSRQSTRPVALDGSWTGVRLPHDWRIGHLPDPDADAPAQYPLAMQGFMPTGVAYYRKVFQRAPAGADEHVWLTFDGVQGQSDFWINGYWLGGHSSGYSPVSFDITELLRDVEDGPNVVLVRSDSGEAEGWWYEGGGIYRHVWLETAHDVHVDRDGIYVTTPVAVDSVAVVRGQVRVANRAAIDHDVSIAVELRDPGDALAAGARSTIAVPSTGIADAGFELTVETPCLWNIGRGSLYTARVTLRIDAEDVDVAEQQFGIRALEVAKDAVVINGVRHQVLGVNIHQDFAGVGVALPDRLIEAKLEMLQEMGANTVRIAHHPPTPELVAHADRLGMLVIAENRLFSSAPVHLEHLRGLVRRFRSHPSIFLWSLGNEELHVEGTVLGEAIMRRLLLETRALDRSRPATVGGTSHFDSAFHGMVDVVGIHYLGLLKKLDEVYAYWPDKPYIQDEVGQFTLARGVYETDVANARPGSFTTIGEMLAERFTPDAIDAYELGDIDEDVPRQMTEVFRGPRSIGGCVWAGMDYLGEPTPTRWPGVSASYGARDLIGVPKDYYWLLRALFRPEPLVHAFPHWTWPGRDEQTIPLRVFSNCEEVEVVVNGEIVARVAVVDSAARIEDGVPYRPGELIVRGLRDGVAVAEHRQRTAGPAARLRFVADGSELVPDGRDVLIARVAVVDVDGVLVPNAQHHIRFAVHGGRILGTGNGDPSCHEPHGADHRSAFNGWAAVVVESGTEPGVLELTAESPDLEPAGLVVELDSSVHPHQTRRAIDECRGVAGAHVEARCPPCPTASAT
jgi:beta-galactosidase